MRGTRLTVKRMCQLGSVSRAGYYRYRQRSTPPASQDRALREATCPIVLFLDDDVIPSAGLIEAHQRCYDDESIWAVVGQVLQPGEEPVDVEYDGPNERSL